MPKDTTDEVLKALLELGAELAPAKPIPVELAACIALDYVLEPDEMGF